jgi:hypothetical protein
MASIPQRSLFSWEHIEELGDLERLRLVLEYLPDERLMRDLEQHRGHGRDDYPIRAVWNSVLAGIVFQHKSVEQLRRELSRNGQLRWLCGFDLSRGQQAVPPAWVYTRFFRLLDAHAEQVESMFDELVEQLRQLLPGFGDHLAIDGKEIQTHARRRQGLSTMEPDGRRDVDADTGKKTYRGTREDGSPWEKVVEWFGYKLHLIVDAVYELPVAFEMTKASASEMPAGRQMVENLQQRHPELVEQAQTLAADKGLDDTKLIRQLWDDCGIRPVIDIRNLWKDGEPTRRVSHLSNVVYDHRGTVFCHCPTSGERREMAYGGFEADREALKYRCPAAHYGLECEGRGCCPVRQAVRIPLAEDRRVFTPLARSSYAWQREYKRRTSVERVNSRLDVSFGFNEHFIRGLAKMRLRMGLSLMVMLVMAVGRIREKREPALRSLVAAA